MEKCDESKREWRLVVVRSKLVVEGVLPEGDVRYIYHNIYYFNHTSLEVVANRFELAH